MYAYNYIQFTTRLLSNVFLIIEYNKKCILLLSMHIFNCYFKNLQNTKDLYLM